MPRQDVPYGGAICRLRERIAEIFDKLGEKLHTINGVPGDGNGNVKIVSGSSAVVISNDPTQNEIAVSLDTSQLPAASVPSVNGQTGAVALDAGDIPSDGNSDVQTDIDVNKAAISACSSAITSEQLARQAADSTLQTNINSVSASLPSQVVAAVAADPTIALLVSADSDNVKLTGNQSIGGIKTVSTEATGTYSHQISNSQKVKNELDNYAPMIRTTGNQTITGGTKLFTGQCQLLEHGKLYRAGSTGMQINTFYELFNAPFPNGDARVVLEVITLNSYGVIALTQIGTNPSTAEDKVGVLLTNNQIDVDMIVSNGRRILYVKKAVAGDLIVSVKNFNIAGVWQGVPITTGYVPRA